MPKICNTKIPQGDHKCDAKDENQQRGIALLRYIETTIEQIGEVSGLKKIFGNRVSNIVVICIVFAILTQYFGSVATQSAPIAIQKFKQTESFQSIIKFYDDIVCMLDITTSHCKQRNHVTTKTEKETTSVALDKNNINALASAMGDVLTAILEKDKAKTATNSSPTNKQTTEQAADETIDIQKEFTDANDTEREELRKFAIQYNKQTDQTKRYWKKSDLINARNKQTVSAAG